MPTPVARTARAAHRALAALAAVLLAAAPATAAAAQRGPAQPPARGGARRHTEADQRCEHFFLSQADSPFVQSRWDSGLVTIQKGGRKLTLDFHGGVEP